MKWLREAVSDDGGLADMAYLAIGALTLSAIFALIFIFAMSAISYHQCQPITTIGKGDVGTITILPCNFDPLPIGQSAGLIFGAFGALIGALAGYMAATRRSGGRTLTTETTTSARTIVPATTTTVTQTETPAASAANPLPVAIAEMASPMPGTKPKPKRK